MSTQARQPSTTGRAVDAGAVRQLQLAYSQLVKAGNDSVRAAWRFGQCLDSLSDAYTRAELAEAMGLSGGTLYRYHRFFAAYQRPELAEQAAAQLETFNIDLLWQLHDDLRPVEHGRSLAGRRFRYRCNHCHSTDVLREEYEPDDELVGQAAAVAQ
jgi:hypothetical protein